ncbi:MAG TPA: YbhB/YbcL family Raf kinase inhibitor-like protein [Polyangia bacterium]|jgi:Raf kinase inhibitor-like YbhB/YbcL family protein|nr:YbhB/YbcL family Raf kinase inhibitor-like protein [Polyangia bacterium]
MRPIDFSRPLSIFLVPLLALGCGSGGGSSGTGGATVTGSGGATGTGGATTGSGGSIGTGGSHGSGGETGTGGSAAGTGGSVDAATDVGSLDAPVEVAPDVPAGPFALTSTAFTTGMNIPLMYKCAQAGNLPMGMNISPPLAWTPGPPGIMSYAMTLIHQGASDTAKHWLMWDIPASVMSLPVNLDHVAMPATPAGAKQVHLNNLDGFTGNGYQGPCPQAAGAQQSYLFAVYALKVTTIPNLTPQSDPETVYSAIQSNMVQNGRATLQVTQTRQ